MRTKFIFLFLGLTVFFHSLPLLADSQGFFAGTDLAYWDYKQEDSLFFSAKETRTGKLWTGGPRVGYMVLPDSGVGLLAQFSILRAFDQELSPVRDENHNWFLRLEGDALVPLGEVIVFKLGVNMMKHIRSYKSIPFYGLGFQAGIGARFQKFLASFSYEESGTVFEFLGDKKRLTGLHLELSYLFF